VLIMDVQLLSGTIGWQAAVRLLVWTASKDERSSARFDVPASLPTVDIGDVLRSAEDALAPDTAPEYPGLTRGQPDPGRLRRRRPPPSWANWNPNAVPAVCGPMMEENAGGYPFSADEIARLEAYRRAMRAGYFHDRRSDAEPL